MSEKKKIDLFRFLRITYEMIEDPKTNDLITWNYENQTFIIWDEIKFASTLLPLNFRHNNMSSFVYQLNNYGFRKVNNAPWEYYNQWFQPGRMDLLHNIKKRSTNRKKQKRREEGTDTIPEIMNEYMEIEKELKKLKHDHRYMTFDINELKRERPKLEEEMVNARAEEEKEEDMVDLWMKSLLEPSFVKQVIEHITRNEAKEGHCGMSLSETHSFQVALKEGLKYGDSAKIFPNLNAGNFYDLEKMLNDDNMVTQVDSEEDIAQAGPKLFHEFKELITTPVDSSQEKSSTEKKDDGSGEGCDSMMVLANAVEEVLKQGV